METSDFNYCRTCLNQNNGKMKELELSYGNELKFSDLLNYLLGTSEISINLPTFLCDKCESMLIQAYLFKKQCLESERQFLKLNLNIKLEIKAENYKIPHQLEIDPLLIQSDLQNEKESFIDNNILETDKELLEVESCIESSKSVECNSQQNVPNELNTDENNYLQDALEKNTEEPVGNISKENKRKKAPKRIRKRKFRHGCRRCKICKIKFISSEKFIIHYNKKHSNKSMFTHSRDKNTEECSLNENVSEDEGILSKSYSCLRCRLKFTSRKDYMNHYRKIHHEIKKKHVCPQCGKVVKDLSTHQKTHNNTKAYFCDKCGKSFSIKQNLRAHLRTHTGDCQYECEYCGKKFKYSTTKKKHIEIQHTSIMLVSLECHLCDKKFNYKGNLTRHIRSHTGEKPFECSYCSKRFITTTLLKDHITTHTKEKNEFCKICDKGFATKQYLILHMKVHSKKCKICSKEFDGSTAFREHIKSHKNYPVPERRPKNASSKHNTAPSKHNKYNDVPAECNLCGKIINHKSNLSRHIRSHTGEKPYECSYCSRRFITSTLLKEHITIHTKEKNAICTICDKGFATKRALTVHMKIH